MVLQVQQVYKEFKEIRVLKDYKGIKESLNDEIAEEAGTNTGRSFHPWSRPVGGVWEW